MVYLLTPIRASSTFVMVLTDSRVRSLSSSIVFLIAVWLERASAVPVKRELLHVCA